MGYLKNICLDGECQTVANSDLTQRVEYLEAQNAGEESHAGLKVASDSNGEAIDYQLSDSTVATWKSILGIS